MSGISTYLCMRNSLQREGLKSFLANTDFLVTAEFKCLNEILTANNCERPAELVIISFDRETYASEGGRPWDQFAAQTRHIKARYPQTLTVALLSEKDILDVSDTLLFVADSYLTKDISHDALLFYLQLAMMGEKVCPMTLTPPYIEFHAASPSDRIVHSAAGMIHLSKREETILHHLKLGEPNKLIAQHLGIAEHTVKAHVKTILRKLGVRNRTQAAMWVRENALDSLPTSHDDKVLPLVRSAN